MIFFLHFVSSSDKAHPTKWLLDKSDISEGIEHHNSKRKKAYFLCRRKKKNKILISSTHKGLKFEAMSLTRKNKKKKN